MTRTPPGDDKRDCEHPEDRIKIAIIGRLGVGRRCECGQIFGPFDNTPEAIERVGAVTRPAPGEGGET
jgi:hypothetical protein